MRRLKGRGIKILNSVMKRLKGWCIILMNYLVQRLKDKVRTIRLNVRLVRLA